MNASDFACRSKAEAKPQRREPAGSSAKTIPIRERIWTDVEPGEYSISDYAVSKKLIHLLRHARLPREDDGAIEFRRIKDDLQKYFLHCHHWSDGKWKSSMAGGGGGEKKRSQYCSDSSGTTLYLRALQGHSGRSLIDPSLQDNVIIPDGFLQVHLSCRMCNQFTYHHQFGIDTWRSKFEQQIDRQCSFCLWIPWTKNHKDPDTIDLKTPRHAQYMHKAWKKHQNTENWVHINLAVKKGLKFYQTRWNAIILHETLPACCIPKVVRMETGEVIYEKVYASPRPAPKISLKHGWMKELGSEFAQRLDGQVVQQFKSSQSNQPNPNPDHDRTGQPVVGRDTSDEPGNEQSMLNEVDIDFRITGLQHSVVKQAQNSRVRELVKKIENHPHRHALQHDLQQNEACNPFSTMTKQMIQDVGNVELFELFETDPKDAVHRMPFILE